MKIHSIRFITIPYILIGQSIIFLEKDENKNFCNVLLIFDNEKMVGLLTKIFESRFIYKNFKYWI